MPSGDQLDTVARSAAQPAAPIAHQTVFTRGTRVQGEVAGDEIVLQGAFRGAIRGRFIRVDSSGTVDASLICDVAEILGRFEGTIEAKLVRFGITAVAHGVFEFDRVVVVEGALVNGSFNLDIADPSSVSHTAERRPG